MFSHIYGKQKCLLCGKEFHIKSFLKKHMTEIHNENRQRLYPCFVCDHRSYTKLHLQRHLIIHNTERPFSCTLCTRTFTTKQNLRRHKKRCHELLPIPDADYFVTVKSDDTPGNVLETIDSSIESRVAVEYLPK